MRMVHRGAICLSILVGLGTSLKKRGKEKRRIREKEKRRKGRRWWGWEHLLRKGEKRKGKKRTGE